VKIRQALALCILAAFGVVPAASAQYFGRNKVQYETFDFKVLDRALQYPLLP
jgi:hypothetical protein